MPEKSVKIAEVVFEKPPPFGTNRSKTEMLRPPDASRNSSNQSGSSAEGSGSRKSMGHKLKKLFTFGGRKGRRREVWRSRRFSALAHAHTASRSWLILSDQAIPHDLTVC